MKTIVILGAVFVFVQGTSKPVAVQELQRSSIAHCVKEQGLDESKIKAIMKNPILPEDDDGFIKFFVCYWTQALVIKDGTFDNSHLKISLVDLVAQLNKNIAATDYSKVSEAAVDHCQELPQDSSISLGLKGIKHRNCIMQYIVDYQ